MSASFGRAGIRVSQSLLASKLLLRAAFFSLRCSQAVERSDRAVAIRHLSDLRDAIRELKEIDQPVAVELSRLVEQESKLARAILAMEVRSAPSDDF
jgi:hypothetical protein